MSFRETVTKATDHIIMSKSPNKHNRLYLQAHPMEEGLPEAIDEGRVRCSSSVWCATNVYVFFLHLPGAKTLPQHWLCSSYEERTLITATGSGSRLVPEKRYLAIFDSIYGKVRSRRLSLRHEHQWA